MRSVLFSLMMAFRVFALDVPYLSGRIVDQAGLLSSDSKATLEQRLVALENDTSAQVAVLTIPSLEGEVLESYSIRVVDTWKLGTKEADNGVLFLISKNDRKLRIEVGRGLEGVLPDIYAKRILDDIVVPEFRKARFESGISLGVDAIDQLVRKEPASKVLKKKNVGWTVPFPLLIFFFILITFGRSSRRRNGFYIGGLGGGSGSWSGGGSGGFSGGGGSFGGGGSSSNW